MSNRQNKNMPKSNKAKNTKNNNNNNDGKRSRRNRNRTREGMMDISTAPRAIGVTTFSTRPRISQRGVSGTRVSHRELVAVSIPGSTNFTIQATFSLNPGLSTSFPWLSQIAQNYEMYTVHRISYEWVPIAPTSTRGDIIIAPDYDANDDPPLNEIAMANDFNAATFATWVVQSVPLNRKLLMGLGPKKYVRGSSVSGDLKTYDVGTVFIATNNFLDTSPAGKVFVSYDVEFFGPVTEFVLRPIPKATSLYQNSIDIALASGTDSNFLWDVRRSDPLRIGTPSGAGIFTPPKGNYLIVFSCLPVSTTATTGTLSTLVKLFFNGLPITAGNLFGTIPQIAVYNGASGNGTQCWGQFIMGFSGSDTLWLQINCSSPAAANVNLLRVSTSLFWSLA